MAASQEEVERVPSDQSTVDLRHYWSIVKKRRWLIAATVVVVTAGALAWSMRRPKVYQASATVIVDPQAPKVLGAQDQVVELGSGNNFWINSDYYTTQFRILTSHTLALKVARKYNLHRDSRLFRPCLPGRPRSARSSGSPTASRAASWCRGARTAASSRSPCRASIPHCVRTWPTTSLRSTSSRTSR